MLERCNDPPCPKCGCNQSELVSSSAGLRGGKHERRECGHCGKRFGVNIPAPAGDALAAELGGGVVYRPVRCPGCASDNQVVTSTQGRLRYHRCRDCGQRFKSVEE